MELIRKNKYVHAAFRVVVSTLIAVVVFTILSYGLLFKGFEVHVNTLGEIAPEPFSLLSGLIVGYWVAAIPKILEPLDED